MKTIPLQLTETNARAMYPTAPPEVKKMLEDSCPSGFFLQKITDRVQSFRDVVNIAGRDIQEFELRSGETRSQLASRKIELVAEVYNEGTVLNAGDTTQYKYYPWHKIVKDSAKESGFGLSYYYYGYWDSYSYVGVRHCFKSAELAVDAGQKFIDLYEDMKIR